MRRKEASTSGTAAWLLAYDYLLFPALLLAQAQDRTNQQEELHLLQQA